MSRFTECTVLVVDDDRGIREAMRDLLEDEGCTVAEAHDGAAALSWLEAHPRPSLILLDWNMGEMSGEQFLAQFVTRRFTDIPVVLLTADSRVAAKVPNLRVDGYLKKPVVLDELFAVLEKYGRCA